MSAIDLPSVLLPYQQTLLSTTAAHTVTVVEKSRRTGYSWAAGADAVLTAAAPKGAGGMSVYYMGYNQEMAREFIDYCADWAKSFDLALQGGGPQEGFWTDPDHPEKQIKTFRVEFASGFEVVGLPSVPRALRGKQGMVILDEAAFHDDIKEVLKAALALLMWGGKVLIISTHDGQDNPFAELIEEVRAGRRPYALLRCTLDDALADGLYQRICLVQGKTWSPEAEAAWRAELIAQYGDAADEELFCVPSEGSGAAIPLALIERAMSLPGPVVRWNPGDAFTHLAKHQREAETRDWCERELAPLLAKLDPETPHALGEDFARKGDLTTFIPLAIRRDLVRLAPFIVELRNVPYEQQAQILFFICDRLPRFRAAKLDATGNGGYLAEVAVQRYGARVEAVMLNEPWYRENMPRLKAAFEDGTILLPKDRDTQDDLRLLKYVRGVIRVPERTLGSDGKGRHGDNAIALALAWAAGQAAPEFYDYTPVRAPAGPAGGSRMHMHSDAQEAEDALADAGANAAGWLPSLRGAAFPTSRGRAL